MKLQATEEMLKAQRLLSKQHDIPDHDLNYIGDMDREAINKPPLMMFIVNNPFHNRYRSTVSISKGELP